MIGRRIWHYAVLFGFFSVVFFVEALVTPRLNYGLPFVGYGGTFRYSHLVIGGLKVSLYWLSHLIGLCFVIAMCLYRSVFYNIKKSKAILTAFLLVIFGYLGAKILYIFENLNYVRMHGISFGGVSFFGTVFFMPIAILLIGIGMKFKPLDYMDYCTPSGLIMLAWIRVGCFMHGCCRGITFWTSGRPVVIPVQLIECALDLVLLELIFYVERKKIYKGKLYAFFMGGYGLLRFFVEFLRDTPKNLFFLSHAQWFAIICIVISVIWIKKSKLLVK